MPDLPPLAPEILPFQLPLQRSLPPNGDKGELGGGEKEDFCAWEKKLPATFPHSRQYFCSRPAVSDIVLIYHTIASYCSGQVVAGASESIVSFLEHLLHRTKREEKGSSRKVRTATACKVFQLAFQSSQTHMIYLPLSSRIHNWHTSCLIL